MLYLEPRTVPEYLLEIDKCLLAGLPSLAEQVIVACRNKHPDAGNDGSSLTLRTGITVDMLQHDPRRYSVIIEQLADQIWEILSKIDNYGVAKKDSILEDVIFLNIQTKPKLAEKLLERFENLHHEDGFLYDAVAMHLRAVIDTRLGYYGKAIEKFDRAYTLFRKDRAEGGLQAADWIQRNRLEWVRALSAQGVRSHKLYHDYIALEDSRTNRLRAASIFYGLVPAYKLDARLQRTVAHIRRQARRLRAPRIVIIP